MAGMRHIADFQGAKKPNAPVNWQQRAQHVDVQLNAQLGAG